MTQGWAGFRLQGGVVDTALWLDPLFRVVWCASHKSKHTSAQKDPHQWYHRTPPKKELN